MKQALTENPLAALLWAARGFGYGEGGKRTIWV